MVEEDLEKLVYEAILKAQKEKSLPKFKVPKIKIEKPKKEIKNFGDLSSAFPFEIAKIAKKNPQEIAEIIAKNIPASENILEVKAIAGFLNFYLSPFYFQGQIPCILREKENFGQNKIGGGGKVNIEFISANPTGPITMGNARGGFTGDTLANIMAFSGFDVIREYYINDYGKQVLIFGESILRRILEQRNIKIKYPDYCYQGEYIKTLAAEIDKEIQEDIPHPSSPLKKGRGQEETLNLKSFPLKRGRTWEGDLDKNLIQKISDMAISKMVENAKQITEKLGIKFDEWFSEKSLYKKGEVKKVLKELKKKKLVYEKDGATWIKLEQFGGDKDEVLITREGSETYFLGDIAYLLNKEQRGSKKIIMFLGADHFGHTKRMAAAAKIFGVKSEIKFLVAQFLRLKGGDKFLKISKRKGNFITLEDFVAKVSLPVARFMFLTKDLKSQMEFDIDLAKEKNKKNPVFYVQYAHARMASILRKAKKQGFLNASDDIKKSCFSVLQDESEIALMKKLSEFPEIVATISKNFEIHILPYYIYSLAEKFSLFYRDCPVLSEKKEDIRQARLLLVIASQIVLQNTLRLAGIEAPEAM